MSFGNRTANRQAHSHPLRFSRKEGLESALHFRRAQRSANLASLRDPERSPQNHREVADGLPPIRLIKLGDGVTSKEVAGGTCNFRYMLIGVQP